MHIQGLIRANIAIAFAVMFLSVGGAAQAAIVTFSGADNGVGPTDPRPFSDAAASAFTTAAGATSLITFEGLPVGFFSTLTVAPGVTATITNGDNASCAGICATNEHDPASSADLGYNTTPGGTNHLRVVPFFNSAGETVTFDFASPINAFGAYLTDTQNTFAGPITLTFNDGSSQTFSITKNDSSGGALFFGFTDAGAAITSVAYHTGATETDSRDLWGIDDLRFATIPTSSVPEPATVLLLATGGVAILWAWRRRLKA